MTAADRDTESRAPRVTTIEARTADASASSRPRQQATPIVLNAVTHRNVATIPYADNRLRRILESVPGAILVLDGEGFVTEYNETAAQILNLPLLGCAWSVIAQRELRRDADSDSELRLNDGRWFSLARRSLLTEPGEILLLTDVTESREISEALQRKQRLATIGEMTARFGHQLRTPLSAALLDVEQICRSTDAAAQKTGIRITERLHEIAAMTNDMLRYAAGVKHSNEHLQVKALIDDAASIMRPQLSAGCKLVVDAIDDGIVVSANYSALRGAILNLLTNAKQACGLAARIEMGAVVDNNQVCITVSDNGHGIDAAIRRRIFDPFFTTRTQGTGLGLAVVRSVTEAHGGSLLIDSGSAGTTIAICLPRVESRDNEDRDPETENRDV